MVQYSNVNEIEVAVTKTEIFRINSNEDFVELKGRDILYQIAVFIMDQD